MQLILNHINTFHPLSNQTQKALENELKCVQLSKGDFLLTEGKICNHLYFVEKGLIRGYYNLDGKEITHWFGFENDFVTSFHSFITQKPSVENLQALEPCTLWAISHKSLFKLYDEYPDIERLGRITYEKYYIRLEERYVNSQFKTASERYDNLVETNPQLLQRVSLGYIASYLGISQETLSRIRAK